MVLYLVFIAFSFLIFRDWFGFSPITSGDMGFFYPEQIRQYLNLPFMWESFRDSGLGGPSFIFHGVYFYNLPMGLLGHFLDYGLIERLLWFWPILIIGTMAPILLVRELNLFPSKFYPLSSLIFFINTYFLMIMGGGQLTVVLAYILIPLVFVLFLKARRETSLKNIIFFSLTLIFLIAWDFRFVYLMGIIIGLYLLYFLPETVKNFRKYFKIFLVTGLFVLSVHAFWLLPFLLNYQNPVASLTSAYTTSEAVRFFSFADFSHSFSLLHPNWPENIFGKTYFLQWEFLILPILAYSSLLFIDKSKVKNQMIYFFAFLGLVGAFLAKGSNEPLGEIYLWLFNHLPGFVMFRDSTKFYALVALSYSVLIPYSVWKIYDWISLKFKVQNLFLLFTVCFLLFLIKPAWTGELSGTFRSKEVPGEYVELKNFIAGQSEFFRTFWIPTKQRFAFYTDNHPGIDGVDFLRVASASGVMEKLKNAETEKLLSLAGVKYVILPFDSEGEIFIKDRIYDDQQRQVIETELNKISWLKKIKFSSLDSQTKTVVYEVSGFNDRFWLEDNTALHRTVKKQGQIAWKMINPTKYEVKINNLKTSSTLIFSENFDPRWEIKTGGKVISSEKIYNRLNSFKIENAENQQFFVEFRPQKYVLTGSIIGLLTMLFFWSKKNKIES